MGNLAINLWAVLLAGASSMVVGMIFYADSVYGGEWKKLAKIDTKKFDKQMSRVMPFIFLAALVTAYFLAYMTFLYQNFFGGSWLGAGVMTSLMLWLGASATTVFIHGVLEQRPRRLMIISISNRLFSFLAMGLIIGWLHP
jgi:hypothetical protein